MKRIVAACVLVLATPAFAQAPVPVDGDYSGTASLQGGSNKCQPLYTFKLHIRNRQFTWQLPNKGEQVPVTVNPDGSFAVENGSRFLNGKIEGTALTATTTSRGCGYRWSFTRS